MLRLEATSRFRKDLRRCQKRGYDLAKLSKVLTELQAERPLEPRHRDHPLTGDFASCRECHIEPNWLLIYRVEKDRLVLIAQRTGTHSDLFDE
jgi:mRNA interferase YafQ